MTVKRDIPTNVETQIENQHTVPFHIAQINFPAGTSYLSETQEVTYDGNIFVEGLIRINSFKWGPDGVQRGTVDLLNENNAATAIILNNKDCCDVPIIIYKVYSTGPTTNTDPVLLVRGVLDRSNITPGKTTLSVVTAKAQTEFAPRDFFTIEDGFNWLPHVGTIVQWNGEKYELKGIES